MLAIVNWLMCDFVYARMCTYALYFGVVYFVYLDCLWYEAFRSFIIHGFPWNWYSCTLFLYPQLHWQSFGKTKKTKTNSPIPMDLCMCHLLQCNMDIVLGVLVFVIRCWMKCWLPFGRNFILANQLIIGLCECFRSFSALLAFANDLTSGCLNSFIHWLSNYAH